MAKTSMGGWGEGQLAPLEKRKELRAQREQENYEATTGFKHADFLKQVAEAERNGDRGLTAQLAAGGTPAASPAGDAPAGTPAVPQGGQTPVGGWSGQAPQAGAAAGEGVAASPAKAPK